VIKQKKIRKNKAILDHKKSGETKLIKQINPIQKIEENIKYFLFM
jgi:hypothetical protein